MTLRVEPVKVVVLISHLLVLGERLILGLRNAYSIQQETIGVDVGCLHSSKRAEHHADFSGFEQRHVLINVPLSYVDVALSEEPENLCKQLLFRL